MVWHGVGFPGAGQLSLKPRRAQILEWIELVNRPSWSPAFLDGRNGLAAWSFEHHAC